MSIPGYNSRTTANPKTTRSVKDNMMLKASEKQAAILEDKRARAAQNQSNKTQPNTSQKATAPQRTTTPSRQTTQRTTTPSRQTTQQAAQAQSQPRTQAAPPLTNASPLPQTPTNASPLPQTPNVSNKQNTAASAAPPLPEAPSYESNFAPTPETVQRDVDLVRRAAGVRPGRQSPSTAAEIQLELQNKQGAQQQLADNLSTQIDLTLDAQPKNNNNPVTISNQYSEGELITALGKVYEGFYNELQDGTKLQGRGRLGDVPVINPELLLYPAKDVVPDLQPDTVESPKGPDFGLVIPEGFPLGVGATHKSVGNQFYNCPPEVPTTHPIVHRCKKINKKITNELLKQV